MNDPSNLPTSKSILETVDHLTYRVTTFTTTGLLAGATFSTFQGFPIVQTSLSMASSFALTATACLIPERIFHRASYALVPQVQLSNLTGTGTGTIDDDEERNKMYLQKEQEKERVERTRLFMSHGMGGAVGGSLCGGLFKGRPLPGMLILTPIMLGIAYGELRLQEYKKKRIKELMSMSDSEQ